MATSPLRRFDVADGLPSRTNVYLFNGDVADRGSHAVEIFVLLFCFMLKEPGSVFLSRGNHDGRINYKGGVAQFVVTTIRTCRCEIFEL